MKKLLALLLTVSFSATVHSQVIDLVSLGSGQFDIQVTSGSTWSQDASGVMWTPNVSEGNLVAGTITTVDWSSYVINGFGVRMTLNGVNPNLAFSVTLFDGNFDLIDAWNVSTAGINNVPGIAQFLSIADHGSGDYSSIAGVQIAWGGGNTIDTKVTEIVAVPEPSTYALLALSALGFGGYVVRRRRRA